MPLEDLTGDKYPSDLNAAWPLGSDPKSQGDDHIRGVKNVTQKTLVEANGTTPLPGPLPNFYPPRAQAQGLGFDAKAYIESVGAAPQLILRDLNSPATAINLRGDDGGTHKAVIQLLDGTDTATETLALFEQQADGLQADQSVVTRFLGDARYEQIADALKLIGTPGTNAEITIGPLALKWGSVLTDGTGNASVTYTTPFDGAPRVQLTAVNGSPVIATLNTPINASGFPVKTFTQSGAAVSSNVQWYAIGAAP